MYIPTYSPLISVTEVFPKGDARYAWTEQKRTLEPKTGCSEVNLKRDFNSCCLEGGEDPDAWMKRLTVIKRRLETMGTKLTERDLMIHILGILPKHTKPWSIWQ